MPIQKITNEFINKPLAKELLQKSQETINKIKTQGAKKVETKAPTFAVNSNLPDQQATDLLNTTKDTVASGTLNKTEATNEAIKVSKEDAQNFISSVYGVENKAVKNLIGKDFNFDNIKTKDDVLNLINQISDKYSKEINVQKRGVQTQAATQQAADLLNIDQETLVKSILRLKPGSTLNAENIKAVRDLMIGGMTKLDDLAIKAKSGGPDELMAFRQHFALMSEMQKIFKGVQTETGRALNQFRYVTNDTQFTNLSQREINKINLLTELGGEEEIRNLATLYAGSNAKTKLKFNDDAGLITKFGNTVQGVSSSVSEVYINSILSSPLTHIKNTAGNWVSQGINNLERTIAARQFGQMGRDGVAPYEDLAKAFGKSQAWQEMLTSMGESLSQGKFPQIVNELGGNKFEGRVHAFSGSTFGLNQEGIQGQLGKAIDVAGNVLTLGRLPTKSLTFFDNIFKNMEYRSELYAQSYRDTLMRISEGTLSPDKAPEYLARLVTNPPKEIAQAAYDAALYTTFQTKLGTRGDFIDIGKLVIDAKNQDTLKGVDWIVNGLVPFVQTPANILGFTLERTPGLNLLLKSYREDLMAGGARADIAKAKMELGLAFYGAVATSGYYGYSSGSDQGLARLGKGQMQNTFAYQPKAIRVPYIDQNGNPQAYQLSINGLDPAAQLYGMAADLGSIFRNFKEDNTGEYVKHVAAFALFAGENLVNTPFLENTSQIFKDVSLIQDVLSKGGDVNDPRLKKIAFNYAAGFVPKAAQDVGKIYNNYIAQDPNFSQQKITTELGEYFRKSINEQDLYSKYDILGDTIDKYSTSPLVPFAVSNLKIDPVRNELRILKPEISPFPQNKTVSFGSLLSVDVPLNSYELSNAQKIAGETTKAKLDQLFTSSVYTDTQDEFVKKAMVQKIISESRSQAIDQVFSDPEVNKRILDEAGILANQKALQNNNGQPLTLVPGDVLNEQRQQ